MVKAVFLDIDGTLVSFKTHKVAQSSIDAINTMRKNGIKVFISSGRNIRSITNLGDLEFDGYITMNGGECLVGKDKAIFQKAMCKKDIETLVNYFKTVEEYPCVFVSNDTPPITMNFKNAEVDEVFKMLNYPQPPFIDSSKMVEREIFELILFFNEEQEKRLMPLLPNSVTARWTSHFADVGPKGINKLIGIQKFSEYFGFDISETMAIGDGGNDKEMIEGAAIGVAMANANQSVKDIADYITTSVDDDGVWNALKHFNVI